MREGTRRLGKGIGIGPRKLLVKLTSEATAQELVKSSKKLRLSNDPRIASKVYINPDLTKEEAKQAFERRKSRRQSAAAASGSGMGEERGTVVQSSSEARSTKSSSLTFINRSRASGSNSSRQSVNVTNELSSVVNNVPRVSPPPNLNSAIATTVTLNASAAVFSSGVGLPPCNTSSIAIPAAYVTPAAQSVPAAIDSSLIMLKPM